MCPGEHYSVKVQFIIGPNTEPDSEILVKRTSDLTYEVTAPAEVVYVSNSDPAWIFTRRGRFFHHMHGLLAKLRFW